MHWDFDGENSPFSVPTTVVVVKGKKRVWVIDTHTGPLSMAPIEAWIKVNAKDRDLWVVNSHEDWDHVWGNCAFPNAEIVAESGCADFLATDFMWVYGLNAWGDARNGDVVKHAPTLGFDKKLSWVDEGLSLLHLPGHTKGSLSVWDEEEELLFVGDNLEDPLPYLQWHDFDAYLDTLKEYRRLKPRKILTSHSGIVGEECLDRTQAYLEGLKEGKTVLPKGKIASEIHQQNRLSLVVSKMEEILRNSQGGNFSLEEYLNIVASIETQEPEELEQALNAISLQAELSKEKSLKS